MKETRTFSLPKITDRYGFIKNHPPRLFRDNGLRHKPDHYLMLTKSLDTSDSIDGPNVGLADIIREADQNHVTRVITIGQLFGLGQKLTDGEDVGPSPIRQEFQQRFSQTNNLTIAVFDMDKMTNLNQAFSHFQGSLICSYFAQQLLKFASKMGGLVAIEGEENILITPYGSRETVSHIYDFLQTFMSMRFNISNLKFRQGVSAGVASLTHTRDQSFWRLMELAGGALVHAKRNGKHRISEFSDPIDINRDIGFLFDVHRKEYETLYVPTQEETTKEADFVLNFAGITELSNIVDVCCGSGRHARVFASKGHQVVGVDTSRSAILEARNLSGNSDGLKFYRDDVAILNRTHPECCEMFDLATCMFSSIGYRENDLDILRGVNCLVKKDGLFLLDIPNKPYILSHFQAQSILPNSSEIGTSPLFVDRKFDSETFRIHTTTSTDNHQLFEIDMKLYSLGEITALMGKAGFEPVRVASDFDGTPFDYQSEAENKRLLILAKKIA